MVAVADCPRCQPGKGGGWHPTRETTVLVPAGDRKHHNVRVASTDTERDVLHTMRCLKDEAARSTRRRREETHAAVMAARKAVPPPPPPPDPLLDQEARRALRTELQQEKQRLLAAQQEFADHIERVRKSKRAAADAHEEKLKRLERELMDVKDETIEHDRTEIVAQESEMLAVIIGRRRIAKAKLDARREKDRLDMGIADQEELLKLGLMVPAHLTLAASASLKEVQDGFSHKREQKKSFVEFSTSSIDSLETSIKSAEQRIANATKEREQRRLRVLEQKSSRASASEHKAADGEDDGVCEATSSLLKAELRHRGRDVLLHGHGVSHKVKNETGRKVEVDERKLEENIQKATEALRVAESAHGTRGPVSPPSEPLVWSARLKERPRGVSNVSISREVLRHGTNESLRGPSGGRQGAICDKPPYVEPGIFTTDWGLSSQPSQGEEDIANMTEEDWTAQMEAVRHWELGGLVGLEQEDKAENARYTQRKAIREKIADPEWRPWREKVPKATKSKRGSRRDVQLNLAAQASTGASSTGGDQSSSAHTFSRAPRFGVGAAPVGLPREDNAGATSQPDSELVQVSVAERVAEVEEREAENAASISQSGRQIRREIP